MSGKIHGISYFPNCPQKLVTWGKDVALYEVKTRKNKSEETEENKSKLYSFETLFRILSFRSLIIPKRFKDCGVSGLREPISIRPMSSSFLPCGSHSRPWNGVWQSGNFKVRCAVRYSL